MKIICTVWKLVIMTLRPLLGGNNGCKQCSGDWILVNKSRIAESSNFKDMISKAITIGSFEKPLILWERAILRNCPQAWKAWVIRFKTIAWKRVCKWPRAIPWSRKKNRKAPPIKTQRTAEVLRDASDDLQKITVDHRTIEIITNISAKPIDSDN